MTSVPASKRRRIGETFPDGVGERGGPDEPIADTGFLVALVSRNDRHHDWAANLAEDQTEPLLTCEAVLWETAFHLGSGAAALALISQQLIELAFDCNKHIPQLAALAKRYSDRNPDLADLCLIRMSELYPHHKVITTDREDFRVYRRNKREFIPLVWPPGKGSVKISRWHRGPHGGDRERS